MKSISPIQKFKNLPGPQRTGVAVFLLLILLFSGWFSFLSIGLGTWLLWNWWQKRSSQKSPQMFTPKTNGQPHSSNLPPSTPMPPPPPNAQPGQALPNQNRPSIDWRNQP